MAVKMRVIVVSSNSSIEMTFICRNNRCVISLRPPPGGPIAPKNSYANKPWILKKSTILARCENIGREKLVDCKCKTYHIDQRKFWRVFLVVPVIMIQPLPEQLQIQKYRNVHKVTFNIKLESIEVLSKLKRIFCITSIGGWASYFSLAGMFKSEKRKDTFITMNYDSIIYWNFPKNVDKTESWISTAIALPGRGRKNNVHY